MNKTEWVQKMLTVKKIQKTTHKKFTGFENEEVFVFYPDSLVLNLNKKLPDFTITNAEYVVHKDQNNRHEELHVSGIYQNKRIDTIYKVYTQSDDHFMNFMDFSEEMIENNPIIIAIGKESFSFFETHGFSRLDIMMYPYRKRYSRGDAKKIWSENV